MTGNEDSSGDIDAPGFEVKLDMEHSLVRVRVWGYWTEELFSRFAENMDDVRRESEKCLDFNPPRFLLVDAREQSVQSQSIATLFQSFVSKEGKPMKRTAILVAATLQKIQTRRIHADTSHRVFDTEADALAWLKSE